MERQGGHASSPVLLSALPASPRQIRLAITIGALLLVAFLATIPFAQVRWAAAPSFVIGQQDPAVLGIDPRRVAILPIRIQGSRALIVLASGYLFTALLLVPHTLTFPGAFSPTGLLNAGSQTAAWLLVVWRSVLPAAVLVYALQQ